MKFLKELLPSLIVRISFSIIVFLTAFLSIYFVYQRSILAIINGFFVPGAILLAVCVFSILNNFGFFDFASYGFISVIQSLKKGSVRQYEDLIDYKSRKMKREQVFFYSISDIRNHTYYYIYCNQTHLQDVTLYSKSNSSAYSAAIFDIIIFVC